MTYYYVRVEQFGHNLDFVKFAEWILRSGVGGVDYSKGGWADQMIKNAAPHIRFSKEEDAIAYVLAHGGSYSTTMPEQASPDYSK